MATQLSYNITSVLAITDADASVNALPAETMDSSAYDMAFVGFANFLSGNYIQNSATVNDIKSNIAVSDGALNNAHFFYVADVSGVGTDVYPGGGESTYGAAITQTGTLFGSSAVSNVQLADDSIATLASVVPFGNEFIAMTDISAGTGDDVVISATETLAKGGSSVGDGLLQSVNAALFKKLGKSAALLNDSDLVTSLNTKLYSALSGNMDETSATYSDSKFMKRYVESGRYQDDGADLNADIDYNLNNVLVNMIVTIKGSVVDTDAGSDGPDLSSNSDAINQIFGTVDTDHLIDTVGAGTNTVGDYTITVMISLRNDTRF